MGTITILYPYSPSASFDMDYYLRTHMSMSLAGHDTFTTAEAFVDAFTPHATALQSDITNVTAIVPIVPFSVVDLTETR